MSFLKFLYTINLLKAGFMGFVFVRLILFSCGFCLSVAVAADKYDQGALLFSQGDYLSALSLWAPLAKQGDPMALYSIGLLYDQGKGVNKDARLALEYFQSAADKNLPASQYYLGMKYYAGLGVEKNISKARLLLDKAANNDYLQAQFQLANLYSKGAGGLQDQDLATHWFSRAAENGYSPAQHSLATRFLTGRGAILSLQQGIFWLKKAAEQGDPDAMRDLGFMYFMGMGVTKNLQQSHDLLLVPAEEGSGLAMFLLGKIYTSGANGIGKDLQRAKHWLQRSQKSGYKDARLQLQQLNNHSKPASRTTDIRSEQKQKHIQSHINVDPGLSHDALRFKQLDDNYYLLQILSARQYSSISQLTDQFRDELTYFFNIKKNEEAVFILTYGAYQSYDEAKQAIAQLPEEFQLKSKPWIRQVKHLKPDIITLSKNPM